MLDSLYSLWNSVQFGSSLGTSSLVCLWSYRHIRPCDDRTRISYQPRWPHRLSFPRRCRWSRRISWLVTLDIHVLSTIWIAKTCYVHFQFFFLGWRFWWIVGIVSHHISAANDQCYRKDGWRSRKERMALDYDYWGMHYCLHWFTLSPFHSRFPWYISSHVPLILDQTNFLNAEEKKLVAQRLAVDNMGEVGRMDVLNKKSLKRSFRDYKIYVGYFHPLNHANSDPCCG